MKKVVFGAIMLAINMIGRAQTPKIIIERNNHGVISSVKYSPHDYSDDVPENASSFFEKVLNVRSNDSFILQLAKSAKYGMSFERYKQYYQGIEVEGGYYSFRYKYKRMIAACGNYVSTEKINPTPSILEEDAKQIYAKHLQKKSTDIYKAHINIVITEKPIVNEAVLAYKIYFEKPSMAISDIGYIDAHTGDLIDILPASTCYSALGTFYTYYNNTSTKTARTEYKDSNTGYILYDTTRGIGGIHTYNGTVFPATDFSDMNNIWTESELGNCQMALDVHWTLQQIYDVLKDEYGHYSHDGANDSIVAYVHSTADTHFSANNTLYFTTSHNGYNPMASVDIIAHEYGHAILYNTTNWKNLNSGIVLHEGFADIWGLLFEHHITPNADIWKTGEDVVIGYCCERDFTYPTNPNAHTQIASTYNYGLYNSNDPHVKGGIAPHWFYRLVYGGSGINEKNDTYTVYPVGLDLAEMLFTFTALNPTYLENCNTFTQVRQAFVDAANNIGNPFLEMQVANAWYAVGVGSQPSQINLSGPTIPGSSSVYSIQNLPSGYNVTWTYIPKSGTSLPSGSFITNSPATNQCTINNSSKQYIKGTLKATITKSGTTIATLEKEIRSGDGFSATCSQPLGYIIPIHGNFENSNSTSAEFSDDAAFAVKKNSSGSYPITITSPYFTNATITHTSISGLSWQHSGNTITFSYPANNNIDPVLVVTGKKSTDYRVYRFSIYSQVDLLLQLTATVSGRDLLLNLSASEESIKNASTEALQSLAEELAEKEWTVTVVSATTGKKVFSQEAKGSTFTIDTTGWESGIYVIKANVGDRELIQKVLVK